MTEKNTVVLLLLLNCSWIGFKLVDKWSYYVGNAIYLLFFVVLRRITLWILTGWRFNSIEKLFQYEQEKGRVLLGWPHENFESYCFK